MEIDTTEPRHGQHGGRENQAIGDNDHQIGPQGGKCRLRSSIPECLGLSDGNGMLSCQLFDRALQDALSTPAGPIGPGINHNHFMGTIQQDMQRR
jgi:hypothetical protein